MPKVIEDQQLYYAVIQTVIERGYAGATTKQMAVAAKVSEATLFRKYGSKPQLVKLAIASIIEETRLDQSSEYTGDLAADLLRMVQGYHLTTKHGQLFAVLFSELPRYSELMEMIDAPYTIFKSFGQLLARYQDEGLLRQEHPLHAVAALLGPVIYMSMVRQAVPQDNIPPFDLSLHVDSFIHGHSAPK